MDFFVVCEKILPHVTKMKIDELGEHALTNYKKGVVKTDHNMLSLEINLTYHIEKDHQRVEMFNLRNKHCQLLFKEYTSKSNILSKCFLSNEPINTQFIKWQKLFEKALHACFRKLRSTNRDKKTSKINILMKEKTDLIKAKSNNKERIIDLEKDISEACQEREWAKLVEVLGSLENDH